MSVDELFSPKFQYRDALLQWHSRPLNRVLNQDGYERAGALLKRPYSEVSESECVELLKEVRGAKADDADAFVPFSKLPQEDFDTPRKAKLFLDKHSEIRRRKPSGQRLEVHAGDWYHCVAKYKRQPTDAEIEKFQEGVEQGKAKARQKKCK